MTASHSDAKLYFDECKQIPSYRVKLSGACATHKRIHSVTSHFPAALREGVRNDTDLSSYYLADINQCIWGGKTTLFGRFCKCILKMFCFPNYREAALLCPLFSQQRCSTLTSQTPMFFMLQPFANIFRIKLCMANAIAQGYLSLAHRRSQTILHLTINSFVCMTTATLRTLLNPSFSR